MQKLCVDSLGGLDFAVTLVLKELGRRRGGSCHAPGDLEAQQQSGHIPTLVGLALRENILHGLLRSYQENITEKVAAVAVATGPGGGGERKRCSENGGGEGQTGRAARHISLLQAWCKAHYPPAIIRMNVLKMVKRLVEDDTNGGKADLVSSQIVEPLAAWATQVKTMLLCRSDGTNHRGGGVGEVAAGPLPALPPAAEKQRAALVESGLLAVVQGLLNFTRGLRVLHEPSIASLPPPYPLFPPSVNTVAAGVDTPISTGTDGSLLLDRVTGGL